jgi:methylated-DNA-protein-cysteine methyltransferase-like protein
MTRKKKPFNHSAKVLRRSDLAQSTGTKSPSRIHANIRAAIRQIPRGKVSTYGAVARAAGFPGSARQVARTLHSSIGLAWQRVLGSGGEIKLRGDSAMEQRFRLEAEGVRFRGKRVDMKAHEFRFPKRRAR